MKIVTEKQVRTEEEASDSRIEGVRIGGMGEDITICFKNVSPENDDGRLEMYFGEKDNWQYKLKISKEGIMFERVNHKYFESLQVRVDEKNPGPKKGTVAWRNRFPYDGEGWDYFYVPFGAVKS